MKEISSLLGQKSFKGILNKIEVLLTHDKIQGNKIRNSCDLFDDMQSQINIHLEQLQQFDNLTTELQSDLDDSAATIKELKYQNKQLMVENT